MLKDRKFGLAWAEGGDPEEYGWHFHDGGSITGYDDYEINSHQDALDKGVPEDILELYEKDGGDYTEPGMRLTDWLQNNSDLFHCQ